MEWDKFEMAQKFLRKANAIHPEDSDDADEALAIQDVYYECYMSSFSRDNLLKRLAEIANGDIVLPEEIELDEAKYRSVCIREAKAIILSLEKGSVQ
jgi:hypothetical protein